MLKIIHCPRNERVSIFFFPGKVMSSSNKNSKMAFIIDKEVPPFYGTKSCHKRIFILSYCTYSPCGKTATKENILVHTVKKCKIYSYMFFMLNVKFNCTLVVQVLYIAHNWIILFNLLWGIYSEL